ncbi:hypothetical protein PV646_37970 [Streptomyces sp. ID05-26A]|nr:hypothetical protein [Streptomyces sp. ID05-26A]
MAVDPVEVVVALATEIRVSLRTGDLTAKASNSQDRTLLAGLGPLRSATRHGEAAVLLETVSGETWLVRLSPTSGLVATVEPATVEPATVEPATVEPAAAELAAAEPIAIAPTTVTPTGAPPHGITPPQQRGGERCATVT